MLKAIITPYNTADLDGDTEYAYTFHLDIGQGRPFCICVVDYPDEEACREAIREHFPNAAVVVVPHKTIVIRDEQAGI